MIKPFLRRCRRDLYFLRNGYLPRLESQPQQRFGSDYGGWHVAIDPIDENSIVYSFGIGQDISFDLALIEKFGLNVYGFDPTPKTIDWIGNHQQIPDRFHFFDWGLADFDGMLTVYEPENPDFVSHTMVNTNATRKIQFPVKRLETCMVELNHDQIDVLKMDIEVAEYSVLESLASSKIRPRQLLVEFHHRVLDMGLERTRAAIGQLGGIGYRMFYVSDSGDEFSFILQPDVKVD